MLLSISYFYLFLGLIGTIVHILRKRPSDSLVAYMSKITLISGATLLPFGILGMIAPSLIWNLAFIPVAVYLFVRLGERFVKELWRESNLEKEQGVA